MERLLLFRPVDLKFKISSPFGVRTINGKTSMHKGIDFAVPEGTPVKSMADGIIYIAGWENPSDHNQGYGYRIWQEFKYDDDTFFSWYGHLSKILVNPKDLVKEGTVIGLSGNTGHSTGPHLHVGVRGKDSGDWHDLKFI